MTDYIISNKKKENRRRFGKIRRIVGLFFVTSGALSLLTLPLIIPLYGLSDSPEKMSGIFFLYSFLPKTALFQVSYIALGVGLLLSKTWARKVFITAILIIIVLAGTTVLALRDETLIKDWGYCIKHANLFSLIVLNIDSPRCLEKNMPNQPSVTECSEIPDNKFFSRYRSRCLTRLVEVSGDVEQCNKIVDENAFGNCVEKLARVNKDVNLCYRISSPVRDSCIINVARIAPAISTALCDTWSSNALDSDHVKLNCYRIAALTNQDLSICGISETQSARCYLSLARSLNDPTVCNLISTETISDLEDKNQCYYWAGKEFLDPIYCERIRPIRGNSRDSCYFHLAVEKLDINLCDKIDNRMSTSNYQEECRSAVEIKL